VECKRFEQQTVISAIPDAQEFQEISSVMPQGIGPIGIYHSHPFSSEIFHSHTDDTTLISLSNQFPNCVSIVTNGKDINYYQIGKNRETNEINVKFIEPEIPKFLTISLAGMFLIKINKNILLNIEDANNLKIRIFNEVGNFLENIWSDLKLFVKNSKISENDAITRYLANKLQANPIQLKISAEMRDDNKIQIILNHNNEPNTKTDSIDDDYECFILDLNAKVPIYISAENKNFEDINNTIKTELIGNNLLPKIYNCIIDFDNRKIITPDNYYLNFFGFYIKVLCFNKQELNEYDFSKKNFEFMSKLVSLFDSFRNIELSNEIKSQIKAFYKDIKKISKQFSWYNEIKKNMNFNKKLLV